MVHALSAASASGIATLASHPFDDIKVCTLFLLDSEYHADRV